MFWKVQSMYFFVCYFFSGACQSSRANFCNHIDMYKDVSRNCHFDRCCRCSSFETFWSWIISRVLSKCSEFNAFVPEHFRTSVSNHSVWFSFSTLQIPAVISINVLLGRRIFNCMENCVPTPFVCCLENSPTWTNRPINKYFCKIGVSQGRVVAYDQHNIQL